MLGEERGDRKEKISLSYLFNPESKPVISDLTQVSLVDKMEELDSQCSTISESEKEKQSRSNPQLFMVGCLNTTIKCYGHKTRTMI